MNIILRLPKDLFEKTLQYYKPSTPSADIIKWNIGAFYDYNCYGQQERTSYYGFYLNNGSCSICSYIRFQLRVPREREWTYDLLCRFFKNSTI